MSTIKINFRRCPIMILLVSALLVYQSFAATYYVRVTGSDANAGSSPASGGSYDDVVRVDGRART